MVGSFRGVRGALKQRLRVRVLSALWMVWRCAGRWVGGQPDQAGNARRALSVWVNWCADGQLSGCGNVGRPDRFTSVAAMAMRRVRIVAWFSTTRSGLVSPRRPVQRVRLWANTAQASLAAFAE